MLRVGIDLVQVSRVAESIAAFGDRFTTRVFTAGERAYAESAPGLTAARYAARFAACYRRNAWRSTFSSA